MRRRWVGLLAGVSLAALVGLAVSQKAQFVVGGALVDAGYRMQDRLARFDFQHTGHDMSASAVWQEFMRQNDLASGVRGVFPRSSYHPVVAMVACMDARLDTNEVTGDTRRYYYILRTAGSVLSPREEEMLELAVRGGVRLVVFTTHTDCAAERAAGDPAQRALYPQLSAGVDEREARIREFMARPAIAERVRRGELMVRRALIHTETGRLTPRS
ncbi:MAG: carbonic anhydrase [Polyangiales bacterium]